MEGRPAAAAGIRPEDLILDVDGVPRASVDDLQRIMTGEVIGRRVTVRLYRDGRILTLDLRPVELTT
jgi:S1-C subfamily serine protease